MLLCKGCGKQVSGEIYSDGTNVYHVEHKPQPKPETKVVLVAAAFMGGRGANSKTMIQVTRATHDIIQRIQGVMQSNRTGGRVALYETTEMIVDHYVKTSTTYKLR